MLHIRYTKLAKNVAPVTEIFDTHLEYKSKFNRTVPGSWGLWRYQKYQDKYVQNGLVLWYVTELCQSFQESASRFVLFKKYSHQDHEKAIKPKERDKIVTYKNLLRWWCYLESCTLVLFWDIWISRKIRSYGFPCFCKCWEVYRFLLSSRLHWSNIHSEPHNTAWN